MEYHVVMEDETGCEFGTTVHAKHHAGAASVANELHPEATVVSVHTPREHELNEQLRHDRLAWEIENDIDHPSRGGC